MFNNIMRSCGFRIDASQSHMIKYFLELRGITGVLHQWPSFDYDINTAIAVIYKHRRDAYLAGLGTELKLFTIPEYEIMRYIIGSIEKSIEKEIRLTKRKANNFEIRIQDNGYGDYVYAHG